MASKKKGKTSARTAALQVLGGSRKPLKASDVIDAVLAHRDVQLGGATPRATVSAILATEAAKEGGLVTRVEPGTFRISAEGRSYLKRKA
jgi:hypothetical protein